MHNLPSRSRQVGMKNHLPSGDLNPRQNRTSHQTPKISARFLLPVNGDLSPVLGLTGLRSASLRICEGMASGFGESTSRSSQGPSFSGNNNNNGDAGDFECNICFELAQDPIVTLCGHLFCWPCVYKWLHIHSHSHECPVCKALVKEESLVPLYGRGKTSTDPRSKSIPGINIPNRPAGQRPETAPPPEQNHFPHRGLGFMGGMGGLGGFAPVATTRFGNFTFSAAIGGFIPSLFNFPLHGFPDPAIYGESAAFPHGFSNAFHGGHIHRHHLRRGTGQGQQDYRLKMLCMIVIVSVIIALAWQ